MEKEVCLDVFGVIRNKDTRVEIFLSEPSLMFCGEIYRQGVKCKKSFVGEIRATDRSQSVLGDISSERETS